MKKVLIIAFFALLALLIDYCMILQVLNQFGSFGEFFRRNPFADVAIVYSLVCNFIVMFFGWVISDGICTK